MKQATLLITNTLLSPTIEKALTRASISSKVDDSSNTVGKRYARTDECGIPFAVTVDNDTLNDNTVTIRELHTMKQTRLSIDDCVKTLADLCNGFTTWAAVIEKFGEVETGKEAEK